MRVSASSLRSLATVLGNENGQAHGDGSVQKETVDGEVITCRACDVTSSIGVNWMARPMVTENE